MTEKNKTSRFRLMKDTLRDLVSIKANFLSRVRAFIRFVRLCWSGAPIIGGMSNIPDPVKQAWAQLIRGESYDPDDVVDKNNAPVMNPMIAFNEAIRGGELSADNPFKGMNVKVAEAWIFEGRFDERGKLIRDPNVLESIGSARRPFRMKHVSSNEEYKSAIEATRSVFEQMPAKVAKSKEAASKRTAAAKRLMEDGLVGWSFLTDSMNTSYDPNQYTEYVPTMGGPFFKQLYLYDMLRSLSLAFEAWNHNPLAKRCIKILTNYAFGRRFDVNIHNDAQRKAWEAFDNKNKIMLKMSNFWVDEGSLYGEIMIDKTKWVSIDPSTVWDIVTNPDDVDDEYYFYQSYPTAYQMYTGYRVPGEPGSEKQAASEYIIRQLPAHNILHRKFNCVSNEKRGRTVLYPILGWLKRVKDLYNAQVVRQWLLSCFVWDVTIKGNQSDVAAYAAQYSQMPPPGSVEVHNESVTRAPMPAMNAGGSKGGGGTDIAESLLAFIATAIGIPKEFLNVISSGGGSRAQALTSAEPFTKVIEDLQARWEEILTEIFMIAMQQAGLSYKKGDVEFIFPSVTKDTTTETLKNIALMESMGWLSKETAGKMAAKEVNITQYDFLDEQRKLKNEVAQGLNQTGSSPTPPGGRFGNDGGSNPDDGQSDIHGQGKVNLSKDLKSI